MNKNEIIAPSLLTIIWVQWNWNYCFIFINTINKNIFILNFNIFETSTS